MADIKKITNLTNLTNLTDLRDMEKDLEKKLVVIRQQISEHPDIIKEKIEKGLDEFMKLIDHKKNKKSKKESIKIMKKSLVNYESLIDIDHNDVRPARHLIHKFMLEDEFVIIVGIYLKAGNTSYEVSLEVKHRQKHVTISDNYKTVSDTMEDIGKVMNIVPAYIFYKPLIKEFINLLHRNLLEYYFDKTY